jgi:lipopolysaccharide biosynthesis glycosyltransferase
MWYRFLLAELLPELSRVLYLDVDILVADRLDELWAMPLEGMGLAAADNVVELALRPRLETLGLPPGACYFNSGVLLLNLERMRATGATQRLLELARLRGTEFLWPDQDALNLVFGAERAPLHPRWNCQNALYWWRGLADGVYGPQAIAEAIAHPAIVHFEGPGLAKPWHYLNKHPLRERWREHLRQTPFPPPPLLGRDLYARMLRPLPAPLIPLMLRAGARLRRLLSSMEPRKGAG